MGFFDELKSAAAAGAQGAVRDAAGSAVASGETAFQKQTGISIAQPLPPAGPAATSGGSSTSAAPSSVSADAQSGQSFTVNKTVLIIAGIALVVLVLLRGRSKKG